eukprot:176061-Pleurochrysis_carterae.AAC.1
MDPTQGPADGPYTGSIMQVACNRFGASLVLPMSVSTVHIEPRNIMNVWFRVDPTQGPFVDPTQGPFVDPTQGPAGGPYTGSIMQVACNS